MHDTTAHCDNQPARTIHEPVMGAEVTALLCEGRPLRIVDATLGTGGHAAMLLEAAPAGACLLGIDRDAQALGLAAMRLKRFGGRVIVREANFSAIAEIAHEAGFARVDALIA